MDVLSKSVVTVATCSMTTRVKCCPFTIFAYLIKTYRTGYTGRFFFVFSIYFLKMDKKPQSIINGPQISFWPLVMNRIWVTQNLGWYLLSKPARYSAIIASFSLKSISYSELGLSPAPESLDFSFSDNSFFSFVNSDWDFCAIAARRFWSLTSDSSWLQTVLN